MEKETVLTVLDNNIAGVKLNRAGASSSVSSQVRSDSK
jgi:hypothetical protein